MITAQLSRPVFDYQTGLAFARASLAMKTDGKIVNNHQARFDYGGFRRGIMVEEGTTNLFTFTEDIANNLTLWAVSNITVTNNTTDVKAPDGSYTAIKLLATGADSYFGQKVNCSAGTIYAGQFWIMSPVSRTISVYTTQTPSHTVTKGSITLEANVWRLITVTETTEADATKMGIQIGGGSLFKTGDILYFWHPQMEQKPYSTSYIRSDANPGVRSAETLTLKTYVDDTVTPTNLLTLNQSTVETDLTGLDGYVTPGAKTLIRDTSTYWQGVASAKLTKVDGDAGTVSICTTTRATVVAGAIYCASAYVKSDASAGKKYRMNIYWYDASNVYISGSVGTLTDISATWGTRLSIVATAPANAAKCYIDATLEGATAGESLWVDGFMLEKVDLSPTPWALGGTEANLLTANQSSAETDTTGFSNIGGSTITRDTTTYKYGSACLKVVTANSVAWEGVALQQSITNTKVYCGSFWIKGSGTVVVSINQINSGWGVNVSKSTPAITLTDSWQRVSVGLLFPSSETYNIALIKILTPTQQSATFYIDGLQLEEIQAVKGWVPGQTRRLIDPYQGTWEQWTYVTDVVKRQVSSQWNRVFQLGNLAVGGSALCMYHADNSADWAILSKNDASTASSGTTADSNTPNGWHSFVVTWGSTKLCLYVDGVARITVNTPNLSSALTQLAYIGSSINSLYTNTLHSHVRVSNCSRPAVDLAAVYAAGVPASTDEWTTYNLPLQEPETYRRAKTVAV